MPHGLPVFDGTEKAGKLKAHYNAIVGALNNALDNIVTLVNSVSANANLRAGTGAQRAAYTSTAPDGFVWQDTDGEKYTWRKDGSQWVRLFVGHYAEHIGQTTSYSITPGGVRRVNIEFPAGRFSVPPIIITGTRDSARDVTASTESVTKDGFTLVLGNATNTSRSAKGVWHAIQRTSTTAGG